MPVGGAADLHVHTTASDGTWEPAEVVEEAAKRGLQAVAITDHDTVNGVASACQAGERWGVAVVPGIELGAEAPAHGVTAADEVTAAQEVHILGYFIDPGSPALREVLENLVAGRRARAEHMLVRLEELGCPIRAGEIERLAKGGVPTRAHVARAMVGAGWVSSMADAFALYLDRGRPAYVPRVHLTPVEAVRLVQAAGGCAVLAHPGLLRNDWFLPGLVEQGLAGIEVWYPEHDPGTVAHYLRLCARYGLIASGGSDCHGPGSGHGTRLGTIRVDVEVIDGLRRASRQENRPHRKNQKVERGGTS
ncbi:MAG TPA: PHP domain-containing protein [Firmicutes bacterium]|nr:PHP domain-containing protein [Bacillota bacterium]